MQRQLGIDDEHQDERADEGHHRDEEVLRTVVGDLADLLQILRHPRDEVPGLLVVVEAERELLQVVEALAAHLGLDIDPEHVAPVVDDHHQTGVQQVDPQQRRGGDEDQSASPGRGAGGR